jgi:hypothetical protein
VDHIRQIDFLMDPNPTTRQDCVRNVIYVCTYFEIEITISRPQGELSPGESCLCLELDFGNIFLYGREIGHSRLTLKTKVDSNLESIGPSSPNTQTGSP